MKTGNAPGPSSLLLELVSASAVVGWQVMVDFYIYYMNYLLLFTYMIYIYYIYEFFMDLGC